MICSQGNIIEGCEQATHAPQEISRVPNACPKRQRSSGIVRVCVFPQHGGIHSLGLFYEAIGPRACPSPDIYVRVSTKESQRKKMSRKKTNNAVSILHPNLLSPALPRRHLIGQAGVRRYPRERSSVSLSPESEGGVGRVHRCNPSSAVFLVISRSVGPPLAVCCLLCRLVYTAGWAGCMMRCNPWVLSHSCVEFTHNQNDLRRSLCLLAPSLSAVHLPNVVCERLYI